MILRRPLPLFHSIRLLSLPSSRPFSSTPSPAQKNRIFQNVRYPSELEDLLLLHSSSHRSLLTLWTASWCPTCQTIAPMIKALIEDGAGETTTTTAGGSSGDAHALPGVGFAEVELDSPSIGDLPFRYQITSTPTLLAFSRAEAQMGTMVRGKRELGQREWVRAWIEEESRRGGMGGAGGGGLMRGLFGGFGGRGG